MFTTVDSSEDIPIKSPTLGTVKDYNTNDIGESCTEWRGVTSKTDIEKCDEETSTENLALKRVKQATNDIRTSCYRKEVDYEVQGIDKDATLNLSVSPYDERSREENVAVCREDTEAESIQCANETTKESGRLCCNVSSRKKILTLLMCNCTLLLCSCSNSLITLFYPQEAQRKGIGLTVQGFVFGVFELVVFLTSPIVGNYVTRIGVKFTCLAGVFLDGGSTILFAVLDKGPAGVSFALTSVACRIVSAMGFTSFYVASMSILANEFGDGMGLAFAITESTMAVGFMVGPVIGGFLYETGGFSLPFYVNGACVFLNGLILYMFLPDVQSESSKDKRQNSIFRLIRSPLFVFSFISLSLSSGGVMMYQSLFATRMARYELRASILGGIFLIGPLAYILSSLLWGYLSRFESLHGFFMILGKFLLGSSFLINEPAIVLAFIPSGLLTTSLSYSMIELGAGLILIISMRCMFTGAYEIGYEKNLETNAMVSGLFNTAISCGGFAGPFLGGAAVDEFGFTNCYTSYGLAIVCFTLVMIGYFSFRYAKTRRGKRTEDTSDYIRMDDV